MAGGPTGPLPRPSRTHRAGRRKQRGKRQRLAATGKVPLVQVHVHEERADAAKQREHRNLFGGLRTPRPETKNECGNRVREHARTQVLPTRGHHRHRSVHEELASTDPVQDPVPQKWPHRTTDRRRSKQIEATVTPNDEHKERSRSGRRDGTPDDRRPGNHGSLQPRGMLSPISRLADNRAMRRLNLKLGYRERVAGDRNQRTTPVTRPPRLRKGHSESAGRAEPSIRPAAVDARRTARRAAIATSRPRRTRPCLDTRRCPET